MKPLIQQTVYVPVRGDETDFKLIQTFEGNEIVPTTEWEMEHLDKKENQYIFTKEELIELVNVCLNYGVELEEKYYSHEEHIKEFINNLLNQQ